MTALDELLRSVLTAEADTQAPPVDLAAVCRRRGRRLRQRRRAGFLATTVVAVAAIVGGTVAVASHTGGADRRQVVVPAGHGSSPSGPVAGTAPRAPWWRAWPTGRVWGAAAPSSFLTSLAPGDDVTVYASGSMADGTEFALYIDKTTEPRVAQWMEDWRTAPDNFGESTQHVAPRARYLAFESPTHSSSGRTQRSQWLIVAGRPGTTTASYSADGTTWRQMHVEHGLAVLGLPGGSPKNAQLRLADASGTYYDGVLAIS